MTHGGGSIGGGGGGGCSTYSGGAFYAGSSAARGRRRSGNTNNDDDCCCAFCYLLLFLACITKMKPRTRIGLTWFYVIGLSILAGSLVGNHYRALTIPVSPTDMRIVDSISSFFCESIITDSQTQMSTYTFNERPTPMASPLQYHHMSVSSSIISDSYEYWGLYLLQGSDVLARVCSDSGLYMYTIKGDSNLEKWREDAPCSDCYMDRYILTGCHDGLHQPARETIRADDSDQYYFLFANIDGYVDLPKSLHVDFYVNRTVYDIDNSVCVCENDFDCTVYLNVIDPQTVVVQIPYEASFDSTVNVICNPRLYIYILLFGFIPVLSGAVITCLILRSARRKNTRERSPSRVFVVSREEQLHGIINESYGHSIGGVNRVAPPSYSAGAPPSYEEATSTRT